MPSLLTVNNAVTRRLRNLTDGKSSDEEVQSKNEQKRHERHVKKQELLRRKSLDTPPEDARLKNLEAKPADDPCGDRYGKLEPEDLKNLQTEAESVKIEHLDETKLGKRVIFRGRVQTERPKSAKLEFYLFRQREYTLQGVLTVRDGLVSEEMVRWAEHIPKESVCVVEGVLAKPPQPIKSATFSDIEVQIDRIYVIAVAAHLPFRLEDAMVPAEVEDFLSEVGSPISATSETSVQDSKAKHQLLSKPTVPEAAPQSITSLDKAAMSGNAALSTIGIHHGSRVEMHTRLENRVFDLRTPVNQSIFRVNSAVCKIFRRYLDSQGFTEIHTPKLQASGSESGSSVFKVDYFKRTAFLAQSPQLFKQMCIAADMERVFEIGPVFRAENSNTHRHLTEYTGLDLEMALSAPKYDYHEAMNLIDGMFISIFESLANDYQREISNIAHQYPVPPFQWKCNDRENTLVLKFKDAVAMLHEAGREQDEDEDLDTPTERFLGQLVKDKYGTDYYILDKFPISARPFYTMVDSEDKRYSNSFDIFMRGQEILSGGQRIHDPDVLAKNLGMSGIDPEDLKEYMDAFRLGVEPHAGGGIGLERVVFLYLNLGNIRWASLFPRDPKSIPARQKKLILKTTAHPMNGFNVPPREFDEDKFGHRIPKGSAKKTETILSEKTLSAATSQQKNEATRTSGKEVKDLEAAVIDKPTVQSADKAVAGPAKPTKPDGAQPQTNGVLNGDAQASTPSTKTPESPTS